MCSLCRVANKAGLGRQAVWNKAVNHMTEQYGASKGSILNHSKIFFKNAPTVQIIAEVLIKISLVYFKMLVQLTQLNCYLV